MIISNRLTGNERGSILVWFAVSMIVMIGMAALAIDLGTGYVAKAQLQNATDAGALAGAGMLYPSPSTSPGSPNWALAQSTALSVTQKNTVAGAYLTNAKIQYGYWNLSTRTWKTGSPVSSGSTPTGVPTGTCSVSMVACTSTSTCPQANDSCNIPEVPAVIVTASKSAGNNGGPLPTIFAGAIGGSGLSPAASSLAAVGAPATAKGTFPYAISVCQITAGKYFPVTSPPTTYTFQGDGNSGQWTDLGTGGGGASVIDNYIKYLGNSADGTAPPPISYGESVYIDNGVKNSAIVDLGKALNGGDLSVIMPVVASGSTSCPNTYNLMNNGGDMTVVGFVEFVITDFSKSAQSFTGYFVAYNPPITNVAGITGGPIYNQASRPALVK